MIPVWIFQFMRYLMNTLSRDTSNQSHVLHRSRPIPHPPTKPNTQHHFPAACPPPKRVQSTSSSPEVISPPSHSVPCGGELELVVITHTPLLERNRDLHSSSCQFCLYFSCFFKGRGPSVGLLTPCVLQMKYKTHVLARSMFKHNVPNNVCLSIPVL